LPSISLVEQIRETVVKLQESSSTSPMDEKNVLLQLEILNELAVVLGAVANGQSSSRTGSSSYNHFIKLPWETDINPFRCSMQLVTSHWLTS
jgi:hypothetical protein